jgi:hypothetical protein
VPEDLDADGLPGVTRSFHDLERHLAERDAFAVGEVADRVLGVGAPPVTDPRAGRLGQLEVAGEEVGVDVCVDHADDAELLFPGVGEVLGDVAARVDNDRSAGGPVADQVGRMGQAVQVVLREDHGVLPDRSRSAVLATTESQARCA